MQNINYNAENMNIDKLNKLINTDFTNFAQQENNVKHKLVIPFLESFNHSNFDFEHAAQGSRIDINIGNRIIVETKALNVNLDMHVQQLSNYSGKELPVLSILTNGKQFRIYSPQWKKQTTFTDKLIYEFELKDLSDMELITRLEKILGFTNYESEDYIDHIEEREREIKKAKTEIEEIKIRKNEDLNNLKDEVNSLKEDLRVLVEQIKVKEEIVYGIKEGKFPEVEQKIKEYYLPFKKRTDSIAQPQILSGTTIFPENINYHGDTDPLEKISVTFPDNTQFKESNVTKVFVNTIQKIGVEKVYTLNLIYLKNPFVSEFKHKLYSQHQIGSYWVTTNFNTPKKFDILVEINKRLSLNLKIEKYTPGI